MASSWEPTESRISWRESSIDAVVLAKAAGMLESEGTGEGMEGRRPCTALAMSWTWLDRAAEAAAEDARASQVSC